MEKKRNYFLLVLRGCAMGAADVVPGVSGGTIAFITGIYEELINSIKSIDLQALKLLFSLKFAGFWKKINGTFLISVLLGIGISIISLARLMTWLLENHPIYIWSFFFGLIIASSLLVAREIKEWKAGTVVALLAGIAIAFFITVTAPAKTPDTWWFIMLSGAIAICAMILPGISGSFILLLLGQYTYIMSAVSTFNIGILLLFATGAVIGIISFSHLLSWLLKNYHNLTIALLTGFMIGSLNKVWPWKETLSTIRDRHGVLQVLQDANVSPARFSELTTLLPTAENHRLILPEVPSKLSGLPATGSEPLLTEAILMCVLGFVLIYGIEIIARRMNK